MKKFTNSNTIFGKSPAKRFANKNNSRCKEFHHMISIIICMFRPDQRGSVLIHQELSLLKRLVREVNSFLGLNHKFSIRSPKIPEREST